MSTLSYEERLQNIISVGEEVIEEDEVKSILKENRFIICYDGFEPSG